LKDASMMIPRTKVNLARAVEELDDLVVSLHLSVYERIKVRADGRMHLRVTRRSRRVKSLKLLPINSRRWKLRDRHDCTRGTRCIVDDARGRVSGVTYMSIIMVI